MLTSLFYREQIQGIRWEDLALLTQVSCISLKVVKHEQSQISKPSGLNFTGCLIGKLGLSVEILSSDSFIQRYLA